MSSDNIQIIKTKILTLQKKQLCNEFRFKKYLRKVLETNNEKQINKLITVKKYLVLQDDELRFCKMIYYKSETDFNVKTKRCGFKHFYKYQFLL